MQVEELGLSRHHVLHKHCEPKGLFPRCAFQCAMLIFHLHEKYILVH